jgi:hypothetical protein
VYNIHQSPISTPGAEIKNLWSSTVIPQNAFEVCDLIKSRDEVVLFYTDPNVAWRLVLIKEHN